MNFLQKRPKIESYEHEIKFTAASTRARVIRDYLRCHCLPDPKYPEGIVASLYYDTPDLRLLDEKTNNGRDSENKQRSADQALTLS